MISTKFWNLINHVNLPCPWGFVRCNTKLEPVQFEPDQFGCFDFYWIQTDNWQAKKYLQILSHLKMKRGLNYCKSQDQASISILFGFYLTFRKPNQSKKNYICDRKRVLCKSVYTEGGPCWCTVSLPPPRKNFWIRPWLHAYLKWIYFATEWQKNYNFEI